MTVQGLWGVNLKGPKFDLPVHFMDCYVVNFFLNIFFRTINEI